MPAPIPSTLPPWRSGDRELIRGYAGWPVSAYNLTQLTASMNRVAEASTAAVVAMQRWIDEVEGLEADWADKVSDGTAHLGNVQEYEGPKPGATLTRQDRQTKADVLEWDSSLLKVRYSAGSRPDSTVGGVLSARIEELKAKILQGLGLKAYDGGGGTARLVRS